ncbi:S9 family peptidase [Chitinophaga sancti]|uniref:Dipeptidyl-peptidase-4 n=1 Tax=Chitinophaga sancti TaxID=1004 RepID=A0A1K1NCC5_9BACT|nr:S9 family peptidase [Chitinophaga sancti]WQD63344.1 S9 family peptidase [Chitinophaga sancti]WQG91030.1 S9 family peptidase [Chitinophaga sancti]SFW33003.1 dipeptidyl-peptidase-4 [Chitinophaga sancti]
MRKFRYTNLFLVLACLTATTAVAQPGQSTKWSRDGQYIYQPSISSIVAVKLSDGSQTEKVPGRLLTQGNYQIRIRDFDFSADEKKLLVYANAERVWRYDTRGDYYVLDLSNNNLKKIGADLPPSSLMFAKFSPDATQVAYVSGHNLYVEDLATGKRKALTTDGTRRLINGTFDWAYEEEFGCRDGFRWSPDSKSIAYWQIDATRIRDFLMIDNTDSIYSYTVPVEYPKAGESPSACRVGVVDIATAKTTWLQVPGDAQQHYIPRMEWVPGKNDLILQQLNRKQNESILFLANAATGKATSFYKETDSAWIDVKSRWDERDISGWDFLANGQSFVWVSEKDGWRHLYTVDMKGKEQLITPGNYDVINLLKVDEAHKVAYILASPDDATQQYLYKVSLDGKGKPERISPLSEPGTHGYEISPDAQYALHDFSNHYYRNQQEIVKLATHKTGEGEQIYKDIISSRRIQKQEFFNVTTVDGVTMTGWMAKPNNFDSTKKYPVVFYVYGEPAGATTLDQYGAGYNHLYNGDMAADGYIYVSLDNRGTPQPKGRTWRKAIYRKVGILNARDQAMGAKELFREHSYMDTSRVAVWGWSGGGSMTLNLMFQYPEIYKTGIAIAAVGNQLTYDNIYQERYMGLPAENREDFVKGSPITYAKNLRGNLLYVHGTGDDNVHYQNAEMLLNELIKYNKIFQFMAYPNRTHGISEGEGTRRHLANLYTNYLKEHCAPGAR